MTGADLRRTREGLGLSRSELARALGVGYRTVLRWEAGRVVIAQPRILALALDRLLDQRAGPRPPCEGSDGAPPPSWAAPGAVSRSTARTAPHRSTT
jgi:transcriptional regulator with XRE-family HTH domain